jgi:type I restriction enzyme M protein
MHSELHKSDNLLRRFEEIHNHLYANDGLSPEQALEEMIKLLFLKIIDEHEPVRAFALDDDEWNSILATNRGEHLIERTNALFERVKHDFSDVFDSNDKIKLSLNALAWSVRALQPISLTDSANDAKGLAFQKFLASRDKTGRGQFFTPEPVIDFCVNIIRPEPHETVIDPACGSGGFLFSALNFVRRTYPHSTSDYALRNLVGYDINTGIARIAKMKLLLESSDSVLRGSVANAVSIFCANTLERSSDDLVRAHHVAAERGGFDIVLANPPFGTTGKITNRQTLANYDLGRKWTQHEGTFHRTNEILSGQVTEILFVERCLSLLREGGRMAIVLPNGHFENSSLAHVRAYIKHHASILAVVNLPQETFIPFGTGVKTSLLFLQKCSNGAASERTIFFGKVTKTGYQGNKNATPVYKKDSHGSVLKDSNGDALVDEDFTPLAEAYHALQSGQQSHSPNAYTLDTASLNGRFDYDFYAPENRSLITLLERKNAVKLSEIATIVREKSPKLAEQDAQVEYIELSDINTHSFEIINTTNQAVHELPSRASYDVRKGDILTAVAGNSVGTSNHATALALAEHEGCICTNGFRILRNPRIDPYYLLFYLKIDIFLRQVFMLRTGAAIPSLSDSDFANILVHLPHNDVIASIAERVRTAFELRAAAREQLRGIVLEL